ncbi:MAG: hypothetical protein CVV05_00680 [Gammaproteobacteria bacterium HGW-Gammaproteobacteria-1]|jgi:defect-in-organelle-trafficking protein DotB|nr:MAG: hypothetical protein CVV05_00680 [Gammaproteobacteria bacterium HGW-Gammaproteobacteria-1]
MSSFNQGQAIPQWPQSTLKITEALFRELMLHVERSGGFDDMYLAEDSPLMVKAGGRMYTVVGRALGNDEMQVITKRIFSDSGVAELMQGIDIDDAFEVNDKDNRKRYRYRVNAKTARTARKSAGIHIVIRSINTTPAKLEELGIGTDIVKGMFPKQGMVLVVGETGSGKSTLLSAAIAEYVSVLEDDKVIQTYESPIENTYDKVNKRNNIIWQHAIPRNIKGGFSRGVRNALRCGPDIILIGEMRDPETIEAGIRASMTGHLLLSTAHANSVVETVRRLANNFSGDMRVARLREIVANLRLVIVQFLAPKIGGGRVPIREHFFFDQETRSELLAYDPEVMLSELDKRVRASGNTMLADARAKFDGGYITRDTLDNIEAGV